jgi:hypothetical protein
MALLTAALVLGCVECIGNAKLERLGRLVCQLCDCIRTNVSTTSLLWSTALSALCMRSATASAQTVQSLSQPITELRNGPERPRRVNLSYPNSCP